MYLKFSLVKDLQHFERKYIVESLQRGGGGGGGGGGETNVMQDSKLHVYPDQGSLAGQTLSQGREGLVTLMHIQYACKLAGLFPASQVWQYLYLFDIFHLFTDSISKPPLDQ